VSALLQPLLDLRARHDPAVFAAMAMRDERTGDRVTLAPHQNRLIRTWESHRRSVQLAPSGFAKSTVFACYLAWRIGRDPSTRIGLLSATKEQAVRLLRLIVIVMQGDEFRRLFPGVAIDRSTADELTVTGRPQTMKDANVLAGGFELSSMLGARFDIAACDDVVTRESCRTKQARDAAYQGFLAVTGSRVGPTGEIHLVNTAEHSDDIPHRLAQLPGWTMQKYPGLDSRGRSTFPARFSIEEIDRKRNELGPIGFRRALMCEPIDASTLVFSAEVIDMAKAAGLSPYLSAIGGRGIIGVDPAWTTGAQSDESGIVHVSIDGNGVRHVVHVEGLRVHHDKLIDRVVALARANRATVYVESNGAGGVIAGAIGKQVPCKALNTNATSKRARVEALSAELASNRWAFSQPLGAPNEELKKLIDDLETFSFEEHCGDRLSALFIASEGARLFEDRPRGRIIQNFDLSRR